MNNAIPDPGIYFYELPDKRWVPVRIEGELLLILKPIGDGLPLRDCVGNLHGPLVCPQ